MTPKSFSWLQGKGCRHLKLHKCNSLQQGGDGQGQSYCLLYALSGQTYLHAAACCLTGTMILHCPDHSVED